MQETMQENLTDELLELIKSDFVSDELIEKLENYHSSDIADALEQVDKDTRLKVYRAIGVKRTSEIFEFYANVEDFIAELDPEIAADIIEEMDSDDAVDLLNELDEEDKSEIIELLEDESKEEVLKIDSYDEDSVGSYMSDNYIVIKLTSTIKEAMNQMIEEAGEHDNIYTLYVVDNDNKYLGAVNLKDLIVARKGHKFEDLIMTSYPSFYDDELMSDVINKLKDYAENSIPILNRNNEIVGVITSDSVIDATEDELTDNYVKFAAITEAEEYNESVASSIKKRIPWLIALLFLGIIVSSVIGSFEGVITTLPVAVFFQSMILDMAGNVGTQSLAVTIKNIDDEENKNSAFKTIFREMRVGFFNGLIIALIGFAFVVAYLMIRHLPVDGGEVFVVKDVFKIAGIISTSLLVAMVVSSFIGTMFPLFLNKIHIDPAVASGPFITTINDVIAVAIYYGLTFLLFIAL